MRAVLSFKNRPKVPEFLGADASRIYKNREGETIHPIYEEDYITSSQNSRYYEVDGEPVHASRYLEVINKKCQAANPSDREIWMIDFPAGKFTRHPHPSGQVWEFEGAARLLASFEALIRKINILESSRGTDWKKIRAQICPVFGDSL